MKPEKPDVGEVSRAFDYDVVAVAEFCADLLEDVNFHKASAAVSRVLERERKIWTKLETAQARHELRQRIAASSGEIQGLPLFSARY